jgi:hypothetical protein
MHKKSICLLLAILLTTILQSWAADITLLNCTEAGLAIARGPLAALSYRNHGQYTKNAKAIHVAADVVRLANEVLSLVNHSQIDYSKGSNRSSCFWIFLDVSNFFLDLITRNRKQKLGTDNIELSQEQKEKINRLVEISQTYLLPFVESTTAFYRALNIDQSAKNYSYRRRAQALCSISRALSIYLNHQQSKMAITLLLGTITEMICILNVQVPGDEPEPPTWEDYAQPIPIQMVGQLAIINEGNNTHPNYVVYRNGVRHHELGAYDPIEQNAWQPGQFVRVLVCNHALQFHVHDNFYPQCPVCNRRLNPWESELLTIPGEIPVAPYVAPAPVATYVAPAPAPEEPPINNQTRVQLIRFINGNIGLDVEQDGYITTTPRTLALGNFRAGQRVRVFVCGHAALEDEDDQMAQIHARDIAIDIANGYPPREETCTKSAVIFFAIVQQKGL